MNYQNRKARKLEIQKLENELKWASGWYRIIDKFLSPSTIGVFALIIGSFITYNNWIEEKQQNSIIEFQKNLLIPSLTHSSILSLLDEDVAGHKAIWSFLFEPDSTILYMQMKVMDDLTSIAILKEDDTIFLNIFFPLLSKQRNKEIWELDKYELEYLIYLDEKCINSSNRIRDQYNEHRLKIFGWQRQSYNNIVTKFNNKNSKIVNNVIVPSGYYYNSQKKFYYLDDFIAKIETSISNKDSMLLHDYFDSLDLNSEKEDLRKSISNIIKKYFKIEEIYSINFRSDKDGNLTVDIHFIPKFKYLFSNKSTLSEAEKEAMEEKFKYGILGSFLSDRFPYLSNTLTHLQYIRFKDNSSKIVFPSYR